MTNFCTLYNSSYSAKGLIMYKSLLEHCSSFHLFIFAFDDNLAEILNRMNLENVTVVTLKEFEDEELLKIKPTRTAGEYCWTCSSSTIWYCINKYNLESCTYIDADLCFFSDPKVLIDEMGNDDVLLTSHRYTPCYDQSLTSGKYCVQFMTFKNTQNGMKILNWWRNACLDWCYNRFEDGKFGDQKYLDDWITRFEGVHELQHLGGGVAPWNMQQYEFKRENGRIMGHELETGKDFELIFFHFHNLQCFDKGFFHYFYSSYYDMPISVEKLIYKDYYQKQIDGFYYMKKYDKTINGIASKSSDVQSYYKLLRLFLSRKKHKDNKYKFWIGK